MPERPSERIVESLRYLRRYGRVLLGSQDAGDAYVRLCLETLLEQQDIVAPGDKFKLNLFKQFHDIWRRCDGRGEEPSRDAAGIITDFSVRSRLDALSGMERQVLLLTTLEHFSLAEVAVILSIPEREATDLLSMAWASVRNQMSTSVLIIEDDLIIAADVARSVSEMGHVVVGVATTYQEATALAAKTHPGLILADIHLGSGGSGLATALEITRRHDVPVIFVTGYPQQLLTGERPEPIYLVTKPFEQQMLHVTVSQALSLSRIAGIVDQTHPSGAA